MSKPGGHRRPPWLFLASPSSLESLPEPERPCAVEARLPGQQWTTPPARGAIPSGGVLVPDWKNSSAVSKNLNKGAVRGSQFRFRRTRVRRYSVARRTNVLVRCVVLIAPGALELSVGVRVRVEETDLLVKRMGTKRSKVAGFSPGSPLGHLTYLTRRENLVKHRAKEPNCLRREFRGRDANRS